MRKGTIYQGSLYRRVGLGIVLCGKERFTREVCIRVIGLGIVLCGKDGFARLKFRYK